VLFLLMVFAPPLVMTITPAKAVSEIEKRPLASFPAWQWNIRSLIAFPARLNGYMNDHFAFRDVLVGCRAWVSIRMLKTSPISSMLIGRDGWFFWNKHMLSEDFRGQHPMSASDMAIFLEGMRSKEEWLAERGIRYLLVIAPEKQTIYPEYLPEYLQQNKGRTRFDQIRASIAKGYPGLDPLVFLDLKDALLKQKKQHQIYYRTDTHWNFRGGLLCYEEMAKRLSSWFPDINPKPRWFFQELVIPDEEGGDLLQQVNAHGFFREDRPIFHPQYVCAGRWPLETINASIPAFGMGCEEEHHKAIVFRDSYFNYVLPFLSEHFNEIIYVWNGYDQTIVEQMIDTLHPDVVIEEFLERFLSPPVTDHRENWKVIQAMSQEHFSAAPIAVAHIAAAKDILPIHDASIDSGSSHLILNASGIDPYVLLQPSIPCNAIHLYLKIRISAPAPTELQAFYLVSGNRKYDEAYSATVSLSSGWNTVYLTLPGTDFNGPIRLDPGKAPGTYEIESIDIRSDGIGTLGQTPIRGSS
jgi:hypothetical protein